MYSNYFIHIECLDQNVWRNTELALLPEEFAIKDCCDVEDILNTCEFIVSRTEK
jgi:hypothetical protein